MLRNFLFNSEELETITPENAEKLINFGIDFYTAFDCFLNHPKFSLNKKFREFIKAIYLLNRSGVVRRNDYELAEIIGVRRETISKLRKRFRQWQESESINLIEIIDGEYVRGENGKLPQKQDTFRHGNKIVKVESKKPAFIYEPTEYRITFGKILIKAICEARKDELYKINPFQAIKKAIDLEVEDVEINHDWSKGKRKIKNARPVSAEQQTARKQVLNWAKKAMKFADVQLNDSAENELDILHDILERAFELLIIEKSNDHKKHLDDWELQQ